MCVLLDQQNRHALAGNPYNNLKYTLNKLDPTGIKPIYVSFDIGIIGNDNLEENEALTMLDYLNSTKRVIGMDMVEVNPTLDKSGKTVKLAMNCIERLFYNKT